MQNKEQNEDNKFIEFVQERTELIDSIITTMIKSLTKEEREQFMIFLITSNYDELIEIFESYVLFEDR